MRSSLRVLLAVVLYTILAVILWGRSGVISDPSHHIVGGGSDPTATMWFLSWWPYALAHRLNPFIANVVWAPSGVNLTWSTSIPALSAAAFPLTQRFGPVVAYNILSLGAPVLSALTAYWLCAYLFSSFWPAVAGGWIYGFSTYQAVELTGGHLSLSFSFIPPLCVLLFIKRYRDEIGRRGFIALLTLLAVIQFLISSEILATTVVFGTFALVVSMSIGGRLHHSRILGAAMEAAAALVCGAVLVSPFLYYMFAWHRPREPLYPIQAYSTDLLGFLLPNNFLYFDGGLLRLKAFEFLRNVGERNGYICLPILIMSVLYIRRVWSNGPGKLLLFMLLITMLAAMGPKLHVLDRPLLPLPWAVAAHLPLIRHALPARFVLYTFLLLAVAAGGWLAAPEVRAAYKFALIGLAVLLSWPAVFNSTIDTPPFFSQGLYARYLPKDALVMIVPFGEEGPSMLWQAQSAMYFRMAGGWTGPTPPEFRDWPVVKGLLSGVTIAPARYQLESFLGRYRVSKVIVAGSGAGWQPAISTLDPAPVHAGGVTIYNVAPDLYRIYRGASAAQAEQAALLAMVRETIAGINRYIEDGKALPELSIGRLRELGLIPDRGETASAARNRPIPETILVFPLSDHSVVLQTWGLPSSLKFLDRIYGGYDNRTHCASPGHIFLMKPDYGCVTWVLDRAALNRACEAETTAALAPADSRGISSGEPVRR